MQPAIILKTPFRKYFEEKWTKTYQIPERNPRFIF
jgi:hypothetical protein